MDHSVINCDKLATVVGRTKLTTLAMVDVPVQFNSVDMNGPLGSNCTGSICCGSVVQQALQQIEAEHGVGAVERQSTLSSCNIRLRAECSTVPGLLAACRPLQPRQYLIMYRSLQIYRCRNYIPRINSRLCGISLPVGQTCLQSNSRCNLITEAG